MSVEEVRQIYEVLVADFADADDPIAPAGPRDGGSLLESAVHRQHTGYGDRDKYEHPLMNAASLAYGLCCDHPFLNGNKRTALVALLVHLDRNEWGLPGVSQDDLYRLMLDLADHRMVSRQGRKTGRLPGTPNPDDEVLGVHEWLRDKAARIERGEKVITYRELRRILSRFGYEIENAGQNSAEVVQYTKEKKGLFRRREEIVRHRIATIGYHTEGTTVAKGELKRIREQCKLSEEDGCDSQSFYTTGVMIDSYVLRYRRVLRRLARR